MPQINEPSSSPPRKSLLNVLLSKTASLSKLEFLVLPHNSQEVLVEFTDFKRALGTSGVTFAFYGGQLFLCSMDGGELTIPQARTLLEGRLKANFDLIETRTIEDFSSDELWFGIGCPIVRDSLRTAIRNKMRGQQDLSLRDLTIFNKKAEGSYGLIAHVLYGVSLKNYVRVDKEKLGLCIEGTLEVFDTEREIVQDQSIRTRLLSSANWNFEKLHDQYYQAIMDAIFPLEMHLGRSTLRFEKDYLLIPSFKQEAVSRSEPAKRGLELWF